MRFVSALTTAVVILLGVLAHDSLAQREEVRIDPEADDLVRRMSKHLIEVRHLSVDLVDTIDEVLESGQKLQFSHRRSLTVSRPDKIHINTTGDLVNREVWKDGKTVTIHDHDHNVYVQIDDPGTIDDMLDLMLERYGVSFPLADFLSADPYKVLMQEVRTGDYIGLHNVDDRKCHHLAFTQEEIDWQLWIDDGDIPAPRKMVITYKLLPGQPQYSFTVKGSPRYSEVSEARFQFVRRAGMEKIEFAPITDESPGSVQPSD